MSMLMNIQVQEIYDVANFIANLYFIQTRGILEQNEKKLSIKQYVGEIH